MEKIQTAEEFLNDIKYVTYSNEEKLITFAKFHVELALKNAVEKIEIDVEYDTDRVAYPILEEASILNSYPLENIK